MENFLSRAKNLLNERNHGVLLTGITLLTEMCRMNGEVTVELRKVWSEREIRKLADRILNRRYFYSKPCQRSSVI